jgi:hypothetical protein
MLVNYAIDLLHAHQIRRENVFLHKELESCRNELTELRNEMKQIQLVGNSHKDTARKAHDLASTHQTQLQDQNQLLSHLQDTNEALQNEFLTITKMYDQLRYNEQHQWAELERKVKGLEKDAHEVSKMHVQDNAKAMDIIDILRTAIESKADATLVNLLVDRLDNLSPRPRPSSVSTSCILESIEQQEPSPSQAYRKHSRSGHRVSIDNAGCSDIQVEDSQKMGTRKTTRGEKAKNLSLEQYSTQRGTTAPEDVDLDANAPILSYAGHYLPERNDPNEEDSLRMLPELNVQASRLAKINTLKQGRYEGWNTYQAKGQSLRDSLPQEFEVTIIQQFVDGISAGVRRAQCRRWLEDAGWRWENVTTFGNLCSQIDDGSRPQEDSKRTNESQISIETDIDQDKSRQSEAQMKEGTPSKKPRQSKWSVATLRRSQRLIERAQTKTTNKISGRPDPARSRSRFESKGPVLHNMKQTMLRDQRWANAEINIKGFLGSGRHRPEAAGSSSSVEHKDSVSSHTGALSGLGRLNPVSIEQRHGVDVFPFTEGLHGSRQISPAVVPEKRRDRESSNDEGYLYPTKLPRVEVSEGGREGQRRTKKRHVPLQAPPQIPIMSTSSDE